MTERILIAEDDPDLRDLLQDELEDAGYDTAICVNGHKALEQIEKSNEQVDLLLTDIRMPGLGGDELLSRVRVTRPEVPVIVITAFGSVEQAVDLVKAGAFQYLTKPFDTGDLLRTVSNALEKTLSQREQARLRRQIPVKPELIVGASRQMQELFK
ncbi:MAG: sigma-54-dependent Fis family transcriptional regulator, partial [Acidobacteria bacterium]|nr:sigma-54-dependent Fis family transcriptional regulator [Acidobacteriota bacterium]